MRVLCSVLVGLAACQSNSPLLLVTAADPQALIEASYGEGDRTVIVRARFEGSSVVSEVFDERNHSMTALAAAAMKREAISVPALLSNAESLRSAMRLTANGLRQLRQSLPPEAAQSALFADLSRQPEALKKALVVTRLALLREWANEIRRRMPMSATEAKGFTDILNRQARAIATPAPGAAPLNGEVAALLGPERYARYTALRQRFTQTGGSRGQEMLP
jgi:hypothetical protein